MKIEFWKSAKNGQWFFHVKARNGEITAQSEGYTTRRACRRGAMRLGAGLGKPNMKLVEIL